MSRYDRLTKAELLVEVERLQQLVAAGDLARARVERDTFAAELEVQNHQLKEAQSQIEESRDRYAELYDLAPFAYATLDDQGVVADINLTGAMFLGRDRAHCLGYPLASFVAHRDARNIARHVIRTRREPGILTTSEVAVRTGSGSELPVELVSRSARHRGVTILHTALIDLSDRRRAADERTRRMHEADQRRQAEEMNVVKDSFLATLGHELRTPLSSIQNWLNILGMRSDDVDLRRRGLLVIQNSVRTQLQLVNDLLDVSRIAHGGIPIERQPLRMSPLLESATADFRASAEEKGVAIHLRLGYGEAEVSGDEVRLRQVFGNLLANALRFTPAGGSVEVRTRRLPATADGEASPARVEVVVQDTGEGIASSFLPHVFERFRQADCSSRRRHSGLGLGLSIARELVTAHGGSIRVDSDGPGHGASFTIELPLSEVAEAPIPARVAPMPARDLVGSLVLLVDDDPAARESIAIVLEARGASVVVAASVAEAITALRGPRPDIVVSDIAMPEADGYDLIEHLRNAAIPTLRTVPIVALSASASEADRRRALAAGFDAYFTKPCDPVALVGHLATLRGNGHPATPRVDGQRQASEAAQE